MSGRGISVYMERTTGFEPATSTLARLHSSQLSYVRIYMESRSPHETTDWICGAGNGTRTRDLLLDRQTL